MKPFPSLLQSAEDQRRQRLNAMSTLEFRERIAAICGIRPAENRPCVRKPTDKGYYPPKPNPKQKGKP